MKKTRLLASFLSLALSLSPLSAITTHAEEADTETAAVTEEIVSDQTETAFTTTMPALTTTMPAVTTTLPADFFDYNYVHLEERPCCIVMGGGEKTFDINEKVDVSKWLFAPGFNNAKSTDLPYYSRYISNNQDKLQTMTYEEASRYCTVDISEVDTSVPGLYPVYIRTKPGISTSFVSENNVKYYVQMIDHVSTFYVKVVDKAAEEAAAGVVKDYSGYIQFIKGKTYFDVHEDFDISDWELVPALCDVYNGAVDYYSWIIDRGNDSTSEFTIGEHSELYTVDSSEVDIKTPGVYNAYIIPKKGASAILQTADKKRNYNLIMTDNVKKVQVTVADTEADMKDISKVEPVFPRFRNNEFKAEEGETLEIYMNHMPGVELDYSIADKSVAVITEINRYDQADRITVKFEKAGITTFRMANTAGECRIWTVTTVHRDKDFRFILNALQGYSDSVISFEFSFGDSPIDDIGFTVEDDTVFKLSDERVINGNTVILSGKFKKVGSTVIRAIAKDGRSEVIDVFTADMTTTIAHTNTLTTTAEISVMPPTTTIEESTMTATTATTDIHTEETLPQTGVTGSRTAECLAAVLILSGTALIAAARKKEE